MKRKNVKLETALAELQSFLTNDIIGINNGGCAYAAIVLYDCIIKHGGTAEIVFMYDEWDEDYTYNLNCINEYKKTFQSCGHAAVRYNNRLIDARGDEVDVLELQHTMTREQTLLSLKYGKWRSLFIHSIFVPIIEEKIGYKFFGDSEI